MGSLYTNAKGGEFFQRSCVHTLSLGKYSGDYENTSNNLQMEPYSGGVRGHDGWQKTYLLFIVKLNTDIKNYSDIHVGTENR